MEIFNLGLEGLKRVSPRLFYDIRGMFFESYQLPKYKEHGIDASFVQDNISHSKKGTIRGLHYQSDPGQAKLVSCLWGSVWDVAVDIRVGSSTFGKWEAVILDGKSQEQLFIPIGFAHGFCVLSDEALLQYKVSSIYHPETERSIRWDDPDLAISWPVLNPTLSDRDRQSPFFKECFQ
ncbi:MAG TPA: dTDP-4-dehydrorhamnose 3,5-epimerase [Chlamydiales bacterium]|nr:dTDP-4-dehydrorhamnose 3,5-epimerase [Chlamydiales bacterium]